MKRAWIVAMGLITSIVFGFGAVARADEVVVTHHDRPEHRVVVVHHPRHHYHHRVVVRPVHHEDVIVR